MNAPNLRLIDPEATLPDHPVNDLMRTCIQILTEPYLTPRKRWQLDIEQSIVDFNPDCEEAKELLDSLMAALENRIGSHRMVVVDEEARALKTAITEAEPCELSEADLAYGNEE